MTYYKCSREILRGKQRGKKCGYAWQGRISTTPVQCPKCKNYNCIQKITEEEYLQIKRMGQ